MSERPEAVTVVLNVTVPEKLYQLMRMKAARENRELDEVAERLLSAWAYGELEFSEEALL